MRSAHSIDRLALLTFSLLAAACGGGEVGSDEQFNTQGPALAYDSYEVLFTNPVCKEYPYADDQLVYAKNGARLEAKPLNAFCSYLDKTASGERPESPQYRLLEWIRDESTTEIFFTYLSFSNSLVQKELCKAVTERDVKITFVLDSGEDEDGVDASAFEKAEALVACEGPSGQHPRFEKRGHKPGIGFAHNKVFIVNPGADTMRLAISSGNMSSGVVTHHENWHFITLPSSTYFAQAHLCMMTAELDHWTSKTEYRTYIKSCLGAIEAKEERDIQAYFVPADDGRASKRLIDSIYEAEAIDIAAHRFSYTKMIKALKKVVDENDVPLRLVADDDLYWAGQGQEVGPNQAFEYTNAKQLVALGAQARWVETNHAEKLLHHNKFLVFDMPEGEDDALFCGAGNLTGTGFTTNWENYYYITIPEVVDAFQEQYEHLWNDLATKPSNMPKKNILPPIE